MNNDFEKNRAEYVTHIEIQMQALQRQLHEAMLGAKWVPQVASEMDNTTGDARLTLAFGGKSQTVTLPVAFLRESQTAAVSSVLDTLITHLITDRLRSVIEPEVEKLQHAARAIDGAGKW